MNCPHYGLPTTTLPLSGHIMKPDWVKTESGSGREWVGIQAGTQWNIFCYFFFFSYPISSDDPKQNESVVGDSISRPENFLLTTSVTVEPLFHFSTESLQETKQSRVLSGAFSYCHQNPSLPALTILDLSHSVAPHSHCHKSKAAFKKVQGNSECSTTIY